VSARAACPSRLVMAGIAVAISTLVLACSSTAAPRPKPTAATDQTVPAVPAAPWTKVWTDSFNGRAGSALNGSVWKYDTGQGTFGTGEIERNTSSTANVRLDGHGHLEIVPLRDGSGWTSARIQTWSSNFGAPAGGEMMVTASIKQPDPATSTGYWPGFWMLGPGRWPMTGEIDILEDINSGSQYSGALHCGNLTQKNPDGTTGPCHEGTGFGSGLQPCSTCQSTYHTYAVVVDRRNAADEQIRWYLDGREFFSMNESRVGTATWTAGVDHGYQIILDVAIGGGYPDGVCRCKSPISQTTPGAAMSIGNVSVYDLKPA
jgi:beta-glucanase (GH16 family)